MEVVGSVGGVEGGVEGEPEVRVEGGDEVVY